MPDPFTDVPGYSEPVVFCGDVPSFHDSEIVSLHLNREGISQLVIRMFGHRRANATDHVQQPFVPLDGTVVPFSLEDVEDLELDGFGIQNVISALSLERAERGFQLKMWPCYGISGWLQAGKVRIEFAPARVDRI
ncbi:MAG: Imm50 family immunity protein [Bryobacteraceae bacterium]